ncbi:RNA-binding domain-containing protein [Pyrodictium occultum]|nr:RNA-binding domain-containing protein [Pyrodictium occultum]
MPTRVIRVEIAAHAHATEDVERVEQAVLNIVPEGLRGRVKLETRTVEGHYNNPITRIVARIEGRDAEEFVRGLARRLDEQSRRILAMMLENRYDQRQGKFYLRFSKQDAFLGELRLHDGDDVVHVVITLRGSPSPEKALKALEELGLKA